MSAALITITIPGALRGKGRPRFGNGRTFTDAKTASAETWIKSCALDQIGRPILQDPLRVSLMIDVDVPASWSKKKRDQALGGLLLPTGKPDLDNAAKLVLDSLNGIVWKDDAQLVELVIARRYAPSAQATLTVRAA